MATHPTKTHLVRTAPKELFCQAFTKACAVEGAEPSSPPAGGEIPLIGIFFLPSFFFCASCRQKKKRNNKFGCVAGYPFRVLGHFSFDTIGAK